MNAVTIAPATFHSSRVPFATIAAAAIAVYFVVKAALLGGSLAVFSLLMAALAAGVALWWLARSRSSAVVIDATQLTVKRGSSTRTYDRSDIESVDLSDTGRQVRFRDGTAIGLPLEGSSLVEAGLLLSPRRPDADTAV